LFDGFRSCECAADCCRESALRHAIILFPFIIFVCEAAMPNYRRNFVLGGSYFFTVNLLERQRSLLTDHIDLLRDSVRRVRRLYSFDIDAWVVLPDHLHCIAF